MEGYRIFLDNPFRILSVTGTRDASAIRAAAERLGTEEAKEAARVLTTPAMRTAAELDWFLEMSRADQFAIIPRIVERDSLMLTRASALALVNALLYNLSIASGRELKLWETLRRLYKEYGSLNAQAITESLNAMRREAGIAECSAQQVGAGLEKKREQIRMIARAFADRLSEQARTELIKGIAQDIKLSGRGAYEQLFDDVPSLKEGLDSLTDAKSILSGDLKQHFEELTKMEQEIFNGSLSISTSPYLMKLTKIETIIRGLDADGGIKKVLRLKLCLQARDFAVRLHNERRRTGDALNIMRALNRNFSDLLEVSAKLQEDERSLSQQNDMLNTAEQARATQQEYREGKVFRGRVALIILVFLIVFGVLVSSCSRSSNSGSSGFSKPASKPTPTAEPTAVEYSESAKLGEYVYADLVLLAPTGAFYTQTTETYGYPYSASSSYTKTVGASYYDTMTCQGMMTDGTEVELEIDMHSYRRQIDDKAPLLVGDDWSEATTLFFFEEPLRVKGVINYAQQEGEGEGILGTVERDTSRLILDVRWIADREEAASTEAQPSAEPLSTAEAQPSVAPQSTAAASEPEDAA